MFNIKFKKFLAILMICFTSLSLTACSDKEKQAMVMSLLNEMMKDNNGSTSFKSQMETIIGNKFKEYRRILNVLESSGSVDNAEGYKTLLDKNEEYLKKAFTTPELTTEIMNSLIWVIDPQYLCNLYNDLNFINEGAKAKAEILTATQNTEDDNAGGNCFMSTNTSSSQIDSDKSNILEKIAETADVSAIGKSLDVINRIKNKTVGDLKTSSNSNNGFWSNLWNSINSIFRDSNNDDKLLKILNEGSTDLNLVRNKAQWKGLNDVQNVSIGNLMDVVGSNGPQLPSNNDGLINDISINDIGKINVNINRDFDANESDKIEEYKQDAEKFCKNYVEAIGNLTKRHALAYYIYNIIEEKDANGRTTSYQFNLKINGYTTEMIFLNQELFNIINGGSASTNNSSSVAQYASLVKTIMDQSRTLYDELEFEGVSGIKDSNISEDSDIIKADTRLGGFNTIADTAQEASSYNTGIKTPKYLIQLNTNEGAKVKPELFRQLLNTYKSSSAENKTKLGTQIMESGNIIAEGDNLETSDKIFKTTDYVGKQDNLKYKKVLEVIAKSDSNRAAVDYNNSLGKDLIITAANIPICALRLMEIDESSNLIISNSQDVGKTQGYLTIAYKDENNNNRTFALKTNVQLQVLKGVDRDSDPATLLFSDYVDNQKYLMYDFLNNTFFKADSTTSTTRTDGLNPSDTENAMINNRFNFDRGIGVAPAGKMTLLTYEPLYYESELSDEKWFPIGRTLYLNKENLNFMKFRDQQAAEVVDKTKPIGYLADPQSNKYSTKTPIYLWDLNEKENTNTVSMTTRSNHIRDTSNLFSGTTIDVPKDLGYWEYSNIELTGGVDQLTNTQYALMYVFNIPQGQDPNISWYNSNINNTQDIVVDAYATTLTPTGKRILKGGYFYIQEELTRDDVNHNVVTNTSESIKKLYYFDDTGHLAIPPDNSYEVDDIGGYIKTTGSNSRAIVKYVGTSSDTTSGNLDISALQRGLDTVADTFTQSSPYYDDNFANYAFEGETVNCSKQCNSYLGAAFMIHDKRTRLSDHYKPLRRNDGTGTFVSTQDIINNQVDFGACGFDKIQIKDINNLKEGDILVRRNNNVGHMICFMGWTGNSAIIRHWADAPPSATNKDYWTRANNNKLLEKNVTIKNNSSGTGINICLYNDINNNLNWSTYEIVLRRK